MFKLFLMCLNVSMSVFPENITADLIAYLFIVVCVRVYLYLSVFESLCSSDCFPCVYVYVCASV